MTLYELDVLAVRWRAQQCRRDLPMALLIQLTANINRDSQQRSQPFELAEVLGWLGHELPPPAPPPQRSPEELTATVELLHSLYSQAQGANGRMDG